MNEYEWTMGPGECERCGAYVPQLVRRVFEPRQGWWDGCGSWLCDECMELEED